MASPEEDKGMLAQVIEFLGLEGDEAEAFFKEGMTRRGHKAVTIINWEPGDGKESGKSKGILGMSNSGEKKNSGSGWQYGG